MLPETHRHLRLPVLHPALEEYRAALETAAKPAWLLKARRVERVSRVETHLGGITPFAPVQDGWPACDRCGEPLSFVWQVDLADFAGIGTFARRGLFQFFYCWECFMFPVDGAGYACRWYPDFDAQQASRIPQLDSPQKANKTVYRSTIGPYALDIIPFLSVPGKFSAENPIPQDAQNEMVGPKEGRLWAVYSFTKGFYLEREMTSRIGGYPPWVQFEDDTPACPVCGKWAEFVGAIGSDDTDLIWGDSGYWYFFACKATPECKGLARPLMAHQCY